MSILTDVMIRKLSGNGKLISGNFREENLTPNGYDLTVENIRLENSDKLLDEAVVPGKSVFWVSTLETLHMPDDVGGQIWIRSSYARKGVLGSFGFIDAGFRGNLTLSFFNGSSSDIRITKGRTIAQVTFIALDSNAEVSYGERSGNYQDQKGLKL